MLAIAHLHACWKKFADKLISACCVTNGGNYVTETGSYAAAAMA